MQSPISLEKAISLTLVGVFAAFALMGAFKYGIWQDRGPGAGFFPFILGTAGLLLSASTLASRAPHGGRLDFRSLGPVAGVLLALAATPLLGMLPALTAFILIWIKFVERRNWSIALIAALPAGIGIHLLFSLWLNVQFPEGILLSMIWQRG